MEFCKKYFRASGEVVVIFVTLLVDSKSFDKFCLRSKVNLVSNVTGKFTNPKSTKNVKGILYTLLVPNRS